jgi:uncharacterized protein with HEPN domain
MEDIVTAIERIEKYTTGHDIDSFLSNEEKQDAVIRNLEVIGEAAGKVPESIRKQAQAIEWRKIIGLRNILVHEYFGVNVPMVWDIVQNKLSPLKAVCIALLNEEK